MYLLYTMRAQRAIKQTCTIHARMFAVEFHSALHRYVQNAFEFPTVLPFGVCSRVFRNSETVVTANFSKTFFAYKRDAFLCALVFFLFQNLLR